MPSLIGRKPSGEGGGDSKEKGGILGTLKRAGAATLTGAVKVLDAPRAATDKFSDIMPGDSEMLVPGIGVLSRVDDLKDDTPKGFAGFARNTALDIVQDPLTYLSFGTGAAAKTGLKTVAKELGQETAEAVAKQGAKKVLDAAARERLVASVAAREGGSVKAGEKLLKALDKGGQGGVKVLGRTVVPGAKLKPLTQPVGNLGRAAAATRPVQALIPRGKLAARVGKDTADEVGGAMARARAAASNRGGAIVKALHSAARAANVTPDELERVVLPALDIGGDVAAVPSRLRPLVDELARVRREATELQDEAGILPTARDTETYVPLRLTKKGNEALHSDRAFAETRLGIPPDQLDAAMKQGGHLRQRTIMPDHPVSDVERVIGGQLRESGKLAGDLVEKNPLTLVARRAVQAERAAANKRMLDEVAQLADKAGQPILVHADDVPARPAGFTEFDVPEVGKFYAPKELADELTQARSVIIGDEALEEFSKLHGRWMALWKTMATVPIIGGFGFHARNLQSNLWNNFLAGVKNPADYARALKIQKAARSPEKAAALSAADRAVLDMAERHGVLQDGFYMSELTDPRNAGGRLGRVTTGQRVRTALNPLSLDNVSVRSGRAVGSAIEGNARLAHFISKLDELGSAEEAALSVRRWLFDYGDLTPTERTFRKFVAFWTFMARNTPRQVDALARQPGKFAGAAHAQLEASEQWAGPLPDWAKQQGMVRVGDMAVGLDLPPLAAAETINPDPTRLVDQVGGPIPSILKALIESRTGVSTFTGGRTQGSDDQRVLEAAFPLIGKVKRSPYVSALKDDPQTGARTIKELTGVSTRNVAEDPAAGGSRKSGRRKGSKGLL